jgi:uncharacterized protein (UPF0335 family)
MSKVKAGPISADRLKSFIERIEKLEEERKAIGGDIRDIYSEAKGVGYDVKTMRKVVQLRKMDEADRAEQETLLDVYLHALGMAMEPAARAVMGGMSYGAAAERFGVPKTSLHRVVPKSDIDAESGTTSTVAETALMEHPPSGKSAGTTERTSGPGSALADHSEADVARPTCAEIAPVESDPWDSVGPIPSRLRRGVATPSAPQLDEREGAAT